MKPFKVNIKDIRSKLGWTQAELAYEIGVSLSTIQRWEQSTSRPSRLAARELERVMQRAGIAKSPGTQN